MAFFKPKNDLCKLSNTIAKVHIIRETIPIGKDRNLSKFLCPLCHKELFWNHRVNEKNFFETTIPKHKTFVRKK